MTKLKLSLFLLLSFSFYAKPEELEQEVIESLVNKNTLKDVESSEDEDIDEIDISEEDAQINQDEDDESAKLILLDKIDAVVASGDNFKIVTTSDISKRDFDGVSHTIDDIINEDLMDILAIRLKLNVSDDDVNKFLGRMGMTQEQIKEIARKNGYYDLAEFYEQFKKMYRASQAQSFKISSELVFSEDVIKEYCVENPKVEEAIYLIECASVAYDRSKDRLDQEKELRDSIKNNKIIIEWGFPVELKSSEISKDNSFVFGMKEGEVFVKATKNCFDLFKLKKLKPEKIYSPEERRQEIIDVLKAEKYNEVVAGIYAKLREEALILKPDFEEYPVPVYSKDLL